MPNLKHVHKRRPRLHIHTEWILPFYRFEIRTVPGDLSLDDRRQRKAIPMEFVEILPSPDDLAFVRAKNDYMENMCRQLSLMTAIPKRFFEKPSHLASWETFGTN
jgi:hypothetical protein